MNNDMMPPVRIAAEPHTAATAGDDSSRILTVTREYTFEAAHFLPNVHDGHKCKRMHGHNYKIDVTMTGPIAKTGFIVDFWDMDKIVCPILEVVDHRVLNEVGIENPTAENIAGFFFDAITKSIHDFTDDEDNLTLVAVCVWETPSCCATLTRAS